MQANDPLFVRRFPLIEVFRPTPRPDLSGIRARRRKLKCELRYMRATLSRLVFRSLNKTHIVWRALGSCLLHIRTQPSTDTGLCVGRSLVHIRGLGWGADPRCECRKNHIERLMALHPGLDRVDFRMFLAGFDAGEQFAARKNTENNAPTS